MRSWRSVPEGNRAAPSACKTMQRGQQKARLRRAKSKAGSVHSELPNLDGFGPRWTSSSSRPSDTTCDKRNLGAKLTAWSGPTSSHGKALKSHSDCPQYLYQWQSVFPEPLRPILMQDSRLLARLAAPTSAAEARP